MAKIETIADCLRNDGREVLADELLEYGRQAEENLNRLVAAREAWDRWNEAAGNQVALVILIGECLGANGGPRGIL